MIEFAERNRISRAIESVDCLIEMTQKAEKKFKSARNWGFVDMFGGGALTGLIKHSQLSGGSDIMNDINRKLDELKRELAEIKVPEGFSVGRMPFATFADFFFDGIFADTYMQSKIMKSLNNARELEKALQQLRGNLSQILRQQ